MIGAFLIDVAVVLAICTLGILISFLVINNPTRLELFSLSFPLGAGALTWSLFILGWIGVPFRLEIIFFVDWTFNPNRYDKERLKQLDHVSRNSQARKTWF